MPILYKLADRICPDDPNRAGLADAGVSGRNCSEKLRLARVDEVNGRERTRQVRLSRID